MDENDIQKVLDGLQEDMGDFAIQRLQEEFKLLKDAYLQEGYDNEKRKGVSSSKRVADIRSLITLYMQARQMQKKFTNKHAAELEIKELLSVDLTDDAYKRLQEAGFYDEPETTKEADRPLNVQEREKLIKAGILKEKDE